MKINNWHQLNCLIYKELNNTIEFPCSIPQFVLSYEDMSLLIVESSKLYNLMYEMKATEDSAWCRILKRPNYTIEATLSSRTDNNLPSCLPLIVSLAFLKYRGFTLQGSLIHSKQVVNLEDIIYY